MRGIRAILDDGPRALADGFSLLELLLAVVILVALVVIGAPALAPLITRADLDGAAADLVADLRHVRFRAIAERTRFRVSFPSPRTFRVCGETSEGSNLFGIGCTTKAIGGGGSLTATPNPGVSPIFDTRGLVTVDAGNAPTHGAIVLTAPEGRSRTIDVGRVGRVALR